jgi:hypothetical protein
MNIKTIFFYIKFWKCLQLKIFIDLLAANGNVIETKGNIAIPNTGLSIFYLGTGTSIKSGVKEG